MVGNRSAQTFRPKLNVRLCQFIAPYVANWGVQQPANAAENGYNWWFKDYTNKKVRLIGLDCMQRNATQLAWLKTVLADAANEGLTVVIAFHSGPVKLVLSSSSSY